MIGLLLVMMIAAALAGWHARGLYSEKDRLDGFHDGLQWAADVEGCPDEMTLEQVIDYADLELHRRRTTQS